MGDLRTDRCKPATNNTTKKKKKPNKSKFFSLGSILYGFIVLKKHINSYVHCLTMIITASFFGFPIRFVCFVIVCCRCRWTITILPLGLQEVAELRRQIAIEHAAKHKKEKVLDTDVPTEFECCFCTTKVCANVSTINA